MGWREGGRNDPNIVCTYELKKKLKKRRGHLCPSLTLLLVFNF
jgi:hypothetical protein